MPDSGRWDVPEFCRVSTLVLACGNFLLGDDGFGCALVEYLKARHRCTRACLIDAGTGVRRILFTLCLSPIRPKHLLIVDAVDVGRTPGELFEIDPADLPMPKLDDFSLHQIPTSNLLRELQELCGVEVRVLACQTGPLPQEVRPGLSPPVQAALPGAARWLEREYLPPRIGPGRRRRRRSGGRARCAQGEGAGPVQAAKDAPSLTARKRRSP
jgi:coenzyme F420 hydrogenase subunit delta